MEQSILITNAGLVLCNPYLPKLFERLGMLRTGDDGHSSWLDTATASRAVYLLQYLVDGQTSAPENTLALNKVMCGFAPNMPIDAHVDLTESERAMCDSLLHAMIMNWPAVSNISVAALRETFLQREGNLEHNEGSWQLNVPRKTIDVMVDQIPWNTSLIRFDWMSDPIHVTW